MIPRILAAAILFPQALSAQEPRSRTIDVTGAGVVQTVPDIALLVIYLRGEGPTPDAATTALAAKQKAVTNGVLSLLGRDNELTTTNVIVIEARGSACADPRGYDNRPRLSTGDCAVAGYVATLQANIRTRSIDKAGTAVGLASRLGASDARLEGYTLSNPDAAKRRASAAAIAVARQQAEALASGAGVTLGRITAIRDQANYDITVTGARTAEFAPPPPPMPMAPPVTIVTKPMPIETRAQVSVTYAIGS